MMTPTKWKWQLDTTSALHAAAVLSDGSTLVAGSEIGYPALTRGNEFVAYKLDPKDGSVIWKWKNGSEGCDEILGAAAGPNGSVILAGYTKRHWITEKITSSIYTAVKLDANGNVVWNLQDESRTREDILTSVAIGHDGSAAMGGKRGDDFFLLKVSADGHELWNWTGQAIGGQNAATAVVVVEDNSIVLAGSTRGVWNGTNAGKYDFAAVKVDADGQEVWRWQDGSQHGDFISSAVAAGDGSVILGGYTEAKTFQANSNFMFQERIVEKFFVTKLDSHGQELWRWQDGSRGSARIFGSAMNGHSSVVVGGFACGDWTGHTKGGCDFAAAKLNATTGTLEQWRWQDGTNEDDFIRAVAGGANGSMILAGYTTHSLSSVIVEVSNNHRSKGVVLMLDVNATYVPDHHTTQHVHHTTGSTHPRRTNSYSNPDTFPHVYFWLVLLAIRICIRLGCRDPDHGNQERITVTTDVRPVPVAVGVSMNSVNSLNGEGVQMISTHGSSTFEVSAEIVRDDDDDDGAEREHLNVHAEFP